MKVTSTVDTWLRMAEISDAALRERAWIEEYEAAFPTVFETYYRAWGRRDLIPEASRTASERIAEVEAADRRS